MLFLVLKTTNILKSYRKIYFLGIYLNGMARESSKTTLHILPPLYKILNFSLLILFFLHWEYQIYKSKTMKNLKKVNRQNLKQFLGGGSVPTCSGRLQYLVGFNGYYACCKEQINNPCSTTVMCMLPIGMCD